MTYTGETLFDQEGMELRFSAYLNRFAALKQSNAANEFMERELLSCFVQVNQARMSDLPQVGMQQNAAINLICTQAFRFGRYKYIQNILQGFLADLSRLYGILESDRDEDEDEDDLAERLRHAKANLLGSETLMLKLVQGVYRVQTVVYNTFKDVALELFGDTGVAGVQEMYERVELGANFWRVAIDNFVKKRILAAYNRLIAKSRFSYKRTDKRITLVFFFDHLLEEVRKGELVNRRRKSFHYYVETDIQEFEYKRIKQVLAEYLQENRQLFLDDSEPKAAVEHVLEIVCFDPSAADYKRLMVDEAIHTMAWETAGGATRDVISQADQLEFIRKQLLASALGVALAYHAVRADLVNAVQVFSTKNMQIFSQADIDEIGRQVAYFRPDLLKKAFWVLLERYFENFLKRKGIDKKDKVEVKQHRRKRLDDETLEELYASGLSRIHKNKLLRKDATRPGMLEFVYGDFETVSKVGRMLQMPGFLTEKLKDSWVNATEKIEFFVIIRLDLLTKSTVDIKKALGEILYKYGIVTR